MEATGSSLAGRRRRRRGRSPGGSGWLRRHWLRIVLGAIFALGFLFAKWITRA